MSTEPEASVEDILASIRKIIAEDDAREAGQQSGPDAHAPQADGAPGHANGGEAEMEPSAPQGRPSDFQASAPPPPLPRSNGDVLTLTRMVRDDGSIEELAAQKVDQSPVDETGQVEEALGYVEQAAPASEDIANDFNDGLIDPDAAQSVTVSFASLEAAMADQLGADVGNDQIELIARPMIKDWLDANLPGLVERVVREEVERLARRR